MSEELVTPDGPLYELVDEMEAAAERQEMRGNYDAEATLLSFKSELFILANEGVDEFRKVRGEWSERDTDE